MRAGRRFFLLLPAVLPVLLAGCRSRDARPALQVADASRARPKPPARFTVGWSPVTGKGDVVQRFASGDLLRTCFHCTYPGYTGGLVIGNMNGSGMGFYPAKPVRGFKSINVFCAQDESIWDLDEKTEYTYGWSENFGKGDDGERLAYVSGRVLAHDEEQVVLASENAGGCYRVMKVALARAGWRHFVIATRIQNRCQHPVRFSFFTGDDPWIGKYASSDGDVGWTPSGLVRREAAFGPGEFIAGGMYDLGNRDLDQSETSFSNQANFFALDPALPLPNFTGFANRFAHGPRDIEGKRPLDNQSMTALNMGWLERKLAPGETMDVSFALGLAQTEEVGTVPRLPALGDEDWSSWRRYMKDPGGGPVLFAAERVQLDLSEKQVDFSAEYILRNPSPDAQGLRIEYPILVGRDQLAPEQVMVDGKAVPVEPSGKGQVAAHFPVSVPPHAVRSFSVRYQQPLRGNRAVYMVTSARRWARPLDRAVFVVRHPAGWYDVRLSYPVRARQTEGRTTTLFAVVQPFLPDRELTVSWRR